MCGIIGYEGSREAAPLLIEGLQRLEYRGYDSAGLAIVDAAKLQIVKREGKLGNLRAALEGAFPAGTSGIAHTRWATHGRPSDANAHPHTDCTNDIAVVHNGIVENYAELRADLMTRGHSFSSETDSEVIAHLIEDRLGQGDDFAAAVRAMLGRIRGSHALAVVCRSEPHRMIAARAGNAGGLVVGYGTDEYFVASDLPALLPETRLVAYLDDGELVEVSGNRVTFSDFNGRRLAKEPSEVPLDPVAAAKGSHEHFMLKEIIEQPACLLDTMRGRVSFAPPGLELSDFEISAGSLASIQRVILVAMGTSLHAAMIGRHYFESIAGIPAEFDNASEFRYREAPIGPETLVISVAQSGETVDTLEAMAEAKQRGALLATVCNTPGAQSTRVADGTVLTRCGPEIGVASTKTLTASTLALYLLACHMGRVRNAIDDQALGRLMEPLVHLPDLVGRVVQQSAEIQHIAQRFHGHQHFLFLGRGLQYPVAMEGALKLKEISYIHAEGYPAGEMKHGPIALIDRSMPVVAIAVRDGLREKMVSNIEQVKARDGMVITVVNEGDDELTTKADCAITVPPTSPDLLPVLTVVPLQLLAYHIAVLRGCDVDQPRNLAKTVTVE